MRYLGCIFLLFLMQTASAVECRVNGGRWWTGSWIPVTVPLIANPSTGRIDLDGYLMECRREFDGGPIAREDILYTLPNALRSTVLSSYKAGLRIRGRDYLSPVPGDVHVVTLPNNSRGYSLDTYMYILLQGTPTNPVIIRQGDEFASFNLRVAGAFGHPFTIYLTAANDFITEPSTCTINGNRPIDVNFDQVDRTRIGESVSSTPIRTNLRLNYSCPDSGVTMPITITFKGASASFDSGVLTMSNPDLGTGLLRAGVQVRPEGKFHTTIYNSSGGDDVTFALTRRPGSAPATGPFSGSGTLVMGVP